MLPSRASPKKTNKSTETRSSYCLPGIGCDVYKIAWIYKMTKSSTVRENSMAWDRCQTSTLQKSKFPFHSKGSSILQASATVIQHWPKTTQGRKNLLHSAMTNPPAVPFQQGNQGRNSRQEWKQKPLASVACSVCFLMWAKTTSPESVPAGPQWPGPSHMHH